MKRTTWSGYPYKDRRCIRVQEMEDALEAAGLESPADITAIIQFWKV